MSKLILGVAILLPLFGALVRVLNLRHQRANSHLVPAGFESVVDVDTLKKMSKYAIETGRLAIFHELMVQSFIIIALFGGLIGYFDGWVCRLTSSPTTQGVLYFIIASGVFACVALPFEMYGDFVIEEKHGFNRSTKMLFLTDFIKGQVLSSIFIAIIVASSLTIMKWSNQHWWLWIWLFLLVFQVFVALIAPRWIEPLFVKVKPLENEALGEDIRKMVARADLRVDRIFQVDASRRSSHTNAYFSGFGPVKRVVLYDTLLEKLNNAEVLGVLAHELGHWRLRHVLKSLVQFQFVSLAACFGGYQIINWSGLPALFGLDQVSVFSRITLALFLGSLLSFALAPLVNAISRKHEWEADAFACKFAQPSALADGLTKLARDNMSNLYPHPLYIVFHGSHPPTLQRVERLRRKQSSAEAAEC